MRLSRAITFSMSLRIVGLLTALLSAGLAMYLQLNTAQVEPVLRYRQDLAAFARVTADDLESVYVPVNRQFEAVAAGRPVTDAWTTRPVSKGELVHPSQWTPTAPDRFRFAASGNPLPEGVWGYFFNAPETVLGVIRPGHALTLAVTDPLLRKLIVVFDKAVVLERIDKRGVYLGLKLAQVAAAQRLLEDAQAEAPEGQPKPELVWIVTQGKNPDLPPLAWFSMELSEDTLGPAAPLEKE